MAGKGDLWKLGTKEVFGFSSCCITAAEVNRIVMLEMMDGTLTPLLPIWSLD